MAANSARAWPPRRGTLPDLEALELLPPAVRRELWEGPQEWSAAAVLEELRELEARLPAPRAAAIMAAQVARWHAKEIAETRKWTPRPARPGLPRLPRQASPHQLAGATMQRGGYAPPR